MISLRGLTDHTLKSYCTYIHSYLDYLSNILHKLPEDVTWDELRTYIRWLQKERNLSDRTINHAISQLRFFTMYVLHKPWDDTQLPMRKFNSYLPYVPPVSEVHSFLDTLPTLKQKAMVTLMYSSGLRVGEVCRLKYSDIQRSSMRIHVAQTKKPLGSLCTPFSESVGSADTFIGSNMTGLRTGFFPQNKILLNIVRPVCCNVR